MAFCAKTAMVFSTNIKKQVKKVGSMLKMDLSNITDVHPAYFGRRWSAGSILLQI
jgi:hypothetical protein